MQFPGSDTNLKLLGGRYQEGDPGASSQNTNVTYGPATAYATEASQPVQQHHDWQLLSTPVGGEVIVARADKRGAALKRVVAKWHLDQGTGIRF